jgi:CYTH domain-containing protein
MDAEEMKYSRMEYERRFLVSPQSDWRRSIEPYSKTYEDKYLHSSRLRLRVLTDNDTGRRVIKLNKKYESDSPYYRVISRILLSPGEYQLFENLEGEHLSKTRYYHRLDGRVFSIDVFEGELEGLILCETEAEGLDELMAVEPPHYADREVTDDSFFQGGNLCKVTRTELTRRLGNGSGE